MEERFYTYKQESAYKSPRSPAELAGILLWQWAWCLFCAWTPKPLNWWRVAWLRLFGARMHGRPFVHPRARIEIPWNLTMRDRACLGDGAVAYSLGEIELKERSTIAQEGYLCTGTHKFDDPNLPLMVGKISVGEDAFIGARAFVLPGVNVGAGALIGACSLVTKDMPEWMVCFGQPCRPVRPRGFKSKQEP